MKIKPGGGFFMPMGWQRLKDDRVKQRLKQRAKILALTREFFVNEGFLEIETPILTPAPGQEPYLNPLKTRLSDAAGTVRDAYLITSPEFAHKKLLAAGFGNIFEITRAFRSGEAWGGLHNPEFTILEWYRTGADYTKIMDDIERLIIFILKTLKRGGCFLEYQNAEINCAAPWERISVTAAFEKYAGLPRSKLAKMCERKVLREMCEKLGYQTGPEDGYEDLFFKIFLNKIEPKLGYSKPVILYDYPAPMAALSRLKKTNPEYAERFEVYIAGRELANAFSELNNAKEQRRRFLEEQELRAKLGKQAVPLDEDFLDAVAHMPKAAGIALGIDRLVMLFTNTAAIEDVLAFPACSIFPNPPIRMNGLVKKRGRM